MNARDLPEKWEREAENLKEAAKGAEASEHARLTYQSYIYRACAAELRAALPEQLLAEKYRKVIAQYDDGGFWDEQGVSAATRKNIQQVFSLVIADLDAQHDEGRALLAEVVRTWKCFCAPGWDHQCTVCRIRKHLEGEQ